MQCFVMWILGLLMYSGGYLQGNVTRASVEDTSIRYFYIDECMQFGLAIISLFQSVEFDLSTAVGHFQRQIQLTKLCNVYHVHMTDRGYLDNLSQNIANTNRDYFNLHELIGIT